MIWAAGANPGDRVVYARRRDGDFLSSSEVLDLAAQAHAAGLVFLAQRRTKQGWDYEATRISPWTARKLGLIEREKRESLSRQLAENEKRRYVKAAGR
jgi:hypothetical protein